MKEDLLDDIIKESGPYRPPGIDIRTCVIIILISRELLLIHYNTINYSLIIMNVFLLEEMLKRTDRASIIPDSKTEETLRADE